MYGRRADGSAFRAYRLDQREYIISISNVDFLFDGVSFSVSSIVCNSHVHSFLIKLYCSITLFWNKINLYFIFLLKYLNISWHIAIYYAQIFVRLVHDLLW